MDRQKVKDALTDAPSLAAAAKRLGMSVSQLAALISDKSLRRELDAETRAIYHESIRRLQRSADRARAVLHKALTDGRISNGRRNAAIAILQAADRTEEHYLRESVLSQLEDDIADELQSGSRPSPSETASTETQPS